eukprot:TRINITY_DN25696_c0_g1_i1.p2 TRINITY_DN25696_c0_g1~~TRINITY_DN25696_c0_g1_i1.p2  ORF type:complete len:141 (+),score=15.78 TRINITY_DN25696_c0_g1_i1:310-732(+)
MCDTKFDLISGANAHVSPTRGSFAERMGAGLSGSGASGENIFNLDLRDFPEPTGMDYAVAWYCDCRVPNRGHRHNLVGAWKTMGVALARANDRVCGVMLGHSGTPSLSSSYQQYADAFNDKFTGNGAFNNDGAFEDNNEV